MNRYLVNRPLITEDAQREWYDSLNTVNSIYFMIVMDERNVGLAYAHNIDTINKAFEGSIFIGDNTFLDTHVPVKTALILTNFFFEDLDFKTTFSTVHEDNSKALAFDRMLGYEEVKRNSPFITNRCERDNFRSKTRPLIKTLLREISTELVFDNEDVKYSFLRNK